MPLTSTLVEILASVSAAGPAGWRSLDEAEEELS